jgi:uncharacterized protein (TIGR00645 family)
MQLKRAEQLLESAIFNSRWLMAPFFVGLVVSLVVVLFRFIVILYEFIIHAWTAGESEIIVGVLSLIDISLIGNLILVIVFAGYENFVSRIDASSHPDWPDWMTKIGFSGTKQKLLASIVAISVIQVLKAFMNLGTAVDNIQLAWLVGIQFAFVLSTLLLVWSDRLGRFNGESD